MQCENLPPGFQAFSLQLSGVSIKSMDPPGQSLNHALWCSWANHPTVHWSTLYKPSRQPSSQLI